MESSHSKLFLTSRVFSGDLKFSGFLLLLYWVASSLGDNMSKQFDFVFPEEKNVLCGAQILDMPSTEGCVNCWC